MKIIGYIVAAVLGVFASLGLTACSFCCYSAIAQPSIFEEAESADYVLFTSPLIALAGAIAGVVCFWRILRGKAEP